ncbi:MAG TPA: isocitrate/isopropylmalate family dehydrogenase [Gaiella sp.]|jgi:3-isopropylmalate dehydrogenase
MSGRRTYVVACLAGHGIGPEVTAAASRALAQVSRQHGFRIDELHPPFDGEAVLRSGHPLPQSTRRATQAADAVLVAGATAQALGGVKAELDLVARVTRVLTVEGEALTTFAALDEDAADWTVERAFACAREREGRVVSVGVGRRWRVRVDRHAEWHDGVDVTHLPLAEALQALALDPGSLGLVVAESVLAEAVMEAPRLADPRRLAATGLLSPTGPGVFAPTHGAEHDIAGQGVANPSEMLVAAALLLDEGLGRRAAAQALEESLGAALRSPRRPADMTSDGVAATTREFVDAVLGLLPSARRDTEFAMAVPR